MSQSSTYNSGGGGGGGIITINGDVGSATGAVISLLSSIYSGTSTFDAAGSTINFKVSDSNNNTSLGFGAGSVYTTGLGNVTLGDIAGGNITSGSNNVGIGFNSLGDLVDGENNIAIGYRSMESTVSGSGNIIIGGGSANIEDLGDNNIVIGVSGGGVSAGMANTIIIGTVTTDSCFISGIDNENLGNTVKVVTMGGSDPDQLGTANITAGSGITITPTANTITIAATGGSSFAWSVITADQTAAVNHGYICNKASTLALALPATSAVGDIIKVTGINTALGWQITQASGQRVFIGASATTSGATGTLTSSEVRDSIEMVCITANTTWQVLSCMGNISVV